MQAYQVLALPQRAPVARARPCAPRRPRPGKPLAAAAAHDLSADLVEAVACLALRTRLKQCRSVACTVSCDALSLLAGRINSVRIDGEGWASPGNLTAQVLECTVGQVLLNYGEMIFRQRIVLTNTPRGSARVVFTAQDLGNFLTHPLLRGALSRVVQGQGFAFEPQSVRIQPGSASSPSGVIEVGGVWRGDGQAYRVQLLPTGSPARAVFPQNAAESGVLVRAVPAGLGAKEEAARLVGDGLSAFFNQLAVNLEGVDMAFQSMRIVGGTGFAGGLAELRLSLLVQSFPPLNVQF